MIRTHVIITTYNRPDYFEALVRSIRSTHSDIVAWNDGSTIPYPTIDCVEMHREPHHGRKAYGSLVHKAFRHATTRTWDRLIMLPDDVIPIGRAIERCEHAWNAIIDPNRIMLNPLVDSRGHVQQWDSHFPVKVGAAWLTGWNDMCFYTDERIRPLLRGRFKPPGEDKKGSGVGSQWTRRVREYGNLWQVDRTLFTHRDGPSMMCPAERLANPL